MIQRELVAKAKMFLKKFPVLTVTGPRQSGKTTFCKQLKPKYHYVNMESPANRAAFKNDPEGFLERYRGGVIIDEAQYTPEIFSYIQVLSDESGKNGEFILTGSQNFLLFEKITQSLAGRVKILNLLPFSLEELNTGKHIYKTWEEFALTGFYPRVYKEKIRPEDFYPDYIQTYVERDVRQIMNINELGLFQTFLTTVAARAGQLVNYSQIANQVGIDEKTVKRWISLLETSFIVYRLLPYHKKINKRLVKSPKIYFYDTGLLCHLLGLKKLNDLKDFYMKGSVYENFVINELMKNRYNKAERPQFSFWRDKTGNEIDLLIQFGLKIDVCLEIKSGKTVHPDFLKGISYFKKYVPEVKKSVLVYGGNESYKQSNILVAGWDKLEKI